MNRVYLYSEEVSNSSDATNTSISASSKSGSPFQGEEGTAVLDPVTLSRWLDSSVEGPSTVSVKVDEKLQEKAVGAHGRYADLVSSSLSSTGEADERRLQRLEEAVGRLRRRFTSLKPPSPSTEPSTHSSSLPPPRVQILRAPSAVRASNTRHSHTQTTAPSPASSSSSSYSRRTAISSLQQLRRDFEGDSEEEEEQYQGLQRSLADLLRLKYPSPTARRTEGDADGLADLLRRLHVKLERKLLKKAQLDILLARSSQCS